MPKNFRKQTGGKKAKTVSAQAAVLRALARRMPPPRPRIRSLGKQHKVATSEARYVTAIKDPFCRMADGVTIPDEYAVPVVTKKFVANIVFGSGTGANISSVAFSLLPSPLVTYADTYCTVNSAVLNTGLSAFSSNPGIYAAVGTTTMEANFASSRVVACGFKLRVDTPQSLRTGRVIFAPIVFNDNVPGPLALGAAAISSTSASADALFGGMPGSYVNSSLLELPGAFEMSMDEMGSKDVILRCKPASPKFLNFSSSRANGYNATMSSDGSGLYTTATGAPVSSSVNSIESSDIPCGHQGWLVYAYGMPFTTSGPATPWFNIETVFHLEGIPPIVTSTGAGLTSTTTAPINEKKESVDFSSVLNRIKNIDVASVLNIAENVSNIYAAATSSVVNAGNYLTNG